jgi:hypothetical protein
MEAQTLTTYFTKYFGSLHAAQVVVRARFWEACK